MKNYFKDFDLEDQKFMLEFLSCEGNITKMTNNGYSYQKTKKKLKKMKQQLEKNFKESQDSLKDYLDYLVSQDILYPEIAKMIYKKHKELA